MVKIEFRETGKHWKDLKKTLPVCQKVFRSKRCSDQNFNLAPKIVASIFRLILIDIVLCRATNWRGDNPDHLRCQSSIRPCDRLLYQVFIANLMKWKWGKSFSCTPIVPNYLPLKPLFSGWGETSVAITTIAVQQTAGDVDEGEQRADHFGKKAADIKEFVLILIENKYWTSWSCVLSGCNPEYLEHGHCS